MTVHFQIPELETDRLNLRLAKPKDLPAIQAFRASPRSKGVGGPYAPDTGFTYLEQLIGQWHLRGYGRWIVTEKTNDQALGLVGIYHPDDWPEAEISWSMFDGGEGKGYAREAAEATRDFVYKVLGWPRIISCIMADNLRSIALAERMGATHTGTAFTHPTIGSLDIWLHQAPSKKDPS